MHDEGYRDCAPWTKQLQTGFLTFRQTSFIISHLLPFQLMTLWPSPRSLWSWCQWWIPQQQLMLLLPLSEHWKESEWTAASLATDSASSMIRKQASVMTKFGEKVRTANGGRDFWTFRCILHQEALCCKSLKMDNVMKVVIKTINFIWSRSLNNCQFDSLLREKDYSL